MKKVKCKHTMWKLSILPWGNCQDCGISVEYHLRELFKRVLPYIPDGQLKKEIEMVLVDGKAEIND